jgi:Predicted transcriptional regulator containing an HTH domain fused to a Zn-ribbon
LSQGVEKTTRERLVEIFLRNPGVEFTLRDLLSMLSLGERDVERLLSDINHAAKTIRRATRNSAHLAMRPPMCRSCGYVFKDLETARIPSKCPKCKSERIAPPAFVLVRRD